MLGTLVSVLILVQIDSAVYLGQIFWPHLVLHCYIFLRVLPCGRWPCTWGKYGESCSSNLHSTTKLTKGIRFWKPIQDQISSSEKKIHEVMETKSRWWTHRNIFFFFSFFNWIFLIVECPLGCSWTGNTTAGALYLDVLLISVEQVYIYKYYYNL